MIADPARRRRAAQAAEPAAAAAAERRRRAPAPGSDDGPAPWDDAPVVHEDPGPGKASAAPTAPTRSSPAASRPSAHSSSYCLALPAEGGQRSGAPTSTHSSPPRSPAAPPSTCAAASRTPAADLPPGDEALARLVAELVIRAGQLEATPAKLELEALQLDLSRLDRLIAGARVTGGEGMRELATERQAVLDAIRHRLT